jgi:hypothetical protein
VSDDVQLTKFIDRCIDAKSSSCPPLSFRKHGGIVNQRSRYDAWKRRSTHAMPYSSGALCLSIRPP